MFNLGFQELLIIFAVAMLLFGPSQLPKLARGMGSAMKEFRRAMRDMEGSGEKEG